MKQSKAEISRRYRIAHPEKYLESQRKYRRDNKERSNSSSRKSRQSHPETRLRYNLQKLYGITLEAYREMESRQEGLCAICRRPPGAKRLAVDHCHTTGAVRSLLCASCNPLLGYAKEDPVILRKAAEYLEQFAISTLNQGVDPWLT